MRGQVRGRVRGRQLHDHEDDEADEDQGRDREDQSPDDVCDHGFASLRVGSRSEGRGGKSGPACLAGMRPPSGRDGGRDVMSGDRDHSRSMPGVRVHSAMFHSSESQSDMLMPSRLAAWAETPATVGDRDDRVALHEACRSSRAPDGHALRDRRSSTSRPRARHRPDRRSAGCSRPCHWGFRTRPVIADPVGHVGLRVDTGEVVGVHLDVGIELLERVRGCRIAAEEDRGVDVAKARCRHRSATTSPGSAPGSPGGRRWSRSGTPRKAGVPSYSRMPSPSLSNDAVLVQQRDGAFEILLEAGVIGRRGIELGRRKHVAGRRAARAIAQFRQQDAVDGHRQGLPDDRIGQETGADRLRRWSGCRPAPGRGSSG